MRFRAEKLCFILFFTCFSGFSWATETRTKGFALDNERSWMLEDQFPQIFLNPANAVKYKDSFYFEYAGEIISSKTLGKGGIFKSLGSNFSFGLITGLPARTELYNNASSPMSFFYDQESIAPNEFRAITPQTHLDLNTAVVTSDGLALSDMGSIFEPSRNNAEKQLFSIYLNYLLGPIQTGLSGYYAHSQDIRGRTATSIDETIKLSNSEIGASIGLYQKNISRIFSFWELSLSHTFLQLDNQYNEQDRSQQKVVAELKSKGLGESKIFLGINLNVARKHSLRIRGSFTSTDTSSRAFAFSNVSGIVSPIFLEDNFSRIGQKWQVGISDEMRFSKNIVWFVGLFAEYVLQKNNFSGKNLQTGNLMRFKVQQELSALSLPFNMGLEAKLYKHWEFRFGIGHHLLNRRGAGDYDEVTSRVRRSVRGAILSTKKIRKRGVGGSSATSALGISWIYGRYRADWLANIHFISDGPNIFSGKVNDLSLSLALVYHYGYGYAKEIKTRKYENSKKQNIQNAQRSNLIGDRLRG